VRAGWLEVHLTTLADIARIPRDQRTDAATGTSRANDFENNFYSELVESSKKLGRKFQWDAILPDTGFDGPVPEKYRPHGASEEKWLAEWAAPPHSGTQAPLAKAQPEQPPKNQPAA